MQVPVGKYQGTYYKQEQVNLFHTAVFLLIVSRDKKNHKFKNRQGKILFIDARKLGVLRDRVHRELTPEDVAKIAGTYHAWRGDEGAGEYADIPGFCMNASIEQVQENNFVLTPGRYVGAEVVKDDGEPFDEKMKRLTTTLGEQFAESERLEKVIRANLAELGYRL